MLTHNSLPLQPPLLPYEHNVIEDFWRAAIHINDKTHNTHSLGQIASLIEQYNAHLLSLQQTNPIPVLLFKQHVQLAGLHFLAGDLASATESLSNGALSLTNDSLHNEKHGMVFGAMDVICCLYKLLVIRTIVHGQYRENGCHNNGQNEKMAKFCCRDETNNANVIGTRRSCAIIKTIRLHISSLKGSLDYQTCRYSQIGQDIERIAWLALHETPTPHALLIHSPNNQCNREMPILKIAKKSVYFTSKECAIIALLSIAKGGERVANGKGGAIENEMPFTSKGVDDQVLDELPIDVLALLVTDCDYNEAVWAPVTFARAGHHVKEAIAMMLSRRLPELVDCNDWIVENFMPTLFTNRITAAWECVRYERIADMCLEFFGSEASEESERCMKNLIDRLTRGLGWKCGRKDAVQQNKYEEHLRTKNHPCHDDPICKIARKENEKVFFYSPAYEFVQ